MKIIAKKKDYNMIIFVNIINFALKSIGHEFGIICQWKSKCMIAISKNDNQHIFDLISPFILSLDRRPSHHLWNVKPFLEGKYHACINIIPSGITKFFLAQTSVITNGLRFFFFLTDISLEFYFNWILAILCVQINSTHKFSYYPIGGLKFKLRIYQKPIKKTITIKCPLYIEILPYIPKTISCT